MDRVAFSVGGFAIHWYGILVAGGFLAGLWTASRRAPSVGISGETVADYGPWVVVGALVGARLWFVVAYWDEEFASQSLTRILNVRAGGLVFHGGLLGASLATVWFARRRRVALWDLADVLAPSIALGHAFGRIGCLFNGCCHGTPTDLPWAVALADAPRGAAGMVHPVQAYEALLLLGLYAALAWQFRRARRYSGHTFVMYLLAYAGIRFAVEFFRGDYGPRLVFGLKPGQVVSLLVLAAGLALLRHRQPRAAAPPAGRS